MREVFALAKAMDLPIHKEPRHNLNVLSDYKQHQVWRKMPRLILQTLDPCVAYGMLFTVQGHLTQKQYLIRHFLFAATLDPQKCFQAELSHAKLWSQFYRPHDAAGWSPWAHCWK